MYVHQKESNKQEDVYITIVSKPSTCTCKPNSINLEFRPIVEQSNKFNCQFNSLLDTLPSHHKCSSKSAKISTPSPELNCKPDCLTTSSSHLVKTQQIHFLRIIIKKNSKKETLNH